ncbi:DUF1223 domain-containing protein [Micromonospora sp. 067-2]|uniref:DUF1223 domain-containing protein n=1 Tax=Micromonospora sp. 067-2 TaxID=2789270 RepID=UPI0039795214
MTEPGRSGSTGADSGFAVVELFTSQGCNSCPPAEEALTDIDQDARKRGEPVFALGFHVDYWDHLGWPDQFADASYSARQEAYARAFGSRGLYTPQMIVNGSVEFVGSDRQRAATEIGSALDAAAATSLGLSVQDSATADAHRMTVTYQVERPPEQAVLNVAVVQRGLVSEIARGENAGRTLRQDNVVRAFTSMSLGVEHGRVDLEMPPDLDPRQASVVGYVQRDGTGAVVGAAAVDLPAGHGDELPSATQR